MKFVELARLALLCLQSTHEVFELQYMRYFALYTVGTDLGRVCQPFLKLVTIGNGFSLKGNTHIQLYD